MASEALQNLSVDILKVLFNETKDGNIFYSPLSIMTAFSMLLLGARHNSSLQLLQGLKLTNVLLENVHGEMNQLLTSCTTPLGKFDKSELKIANGLFIQQNYKTNDAFQSGLVQYYNSEITPVNFENGKIAAKLINQWIENKTNNKIKDMFNDQSFSSLTRLVLANAVYFKDNFKDAFSEKRTTTKPFHKNDELQEDVDMMITNGDYNYAEDNNTGLKMIIIPFNNYHMKLLLILPIKRFGLDAALEKINGNTIRDLVHSTKLNIVSNLEVPKFKISTEMDLKTVMSLLGIKDVFDPNVSDLTGISGDKMVVDKAVHKTFLDVNEHGVEAAAATAMSISLMSAPMFDNETPIEFVADEPFLLSIYHSATDVVLFFGKINNPK